MGNYGWYFGPLAQSLTQQGVSVYATDYRGTGLSSGARWDIPSEAAWTRDIASILAALPRSDVPRFLLGHSLGAALALHAAARLQHVLSGVIVVAPAMTVASDPLPWANYLMFPVGMLIRGRPLIRLPYPDYTAMLAKHADDELARALQTDPYRLRLISSRCSLSAV